MIRGVARTASADLGTPFMPPVGLFLVSTTAMGDKGGRSRQIHAREGNGRGSGRPRRQIATRGPRDATPQSSPGAARGDGAGEVGEADSCARGRRGARR